MYNFTPQSTIKSFEEAYPNEKMTVSNESLKKLIKRLVILNRHYSKDVIENTLHYLVNIQFQRGDITVNQMNDLHLLITQRVDEYYDDFHSYPYMNCCLWFL